MRFSLLINSKIPTIVGIITFISRINTTSDHYFLYFTFYEGLKFHAQLAEHEKSIFTSRPGLLEDFKKWEHHRNN